MANWYYQKNDTQHGPITGRQLKELADSGRLHPDDKVKKDGMEKWTTAKNVKGLFQRTPKPTEPPLVRQRTEVPVNPAEPTGSKKAFPKLLIAGVAALVFIGVLGLTYGSGLFSSDAARLADLEEQKLASARADEQKRMDEINRRDQEREEQRLRDEELRERELAAHDQRMRDEESQQQLDEIAQLQEELEEQKRRTEEANANNGNQLGNGKEIDGPFTRRQKAREKERMLVATENPKTLKLIAEFFSNHGNDIFEPQVPVIFSGKLDKMFQGKVTIEFATTRRVKAIQTAVAKEDWQLAYQYSIGGQERIGGESDYLNYEYQFPSSTSGLLDREDILEQFQKLRNHRAFIVKIKKVGNWTQEMNDAWWYQDPEKEGTARVEKGEGARPISLNEYVNARAYVDGEFVPEGPEWWWKSSQGRSLVATLPDDAGWYFYWYRDRGTIHFFDDRPEIKEFEAGRIAMEKVDETLNATEFLRALRKRAELGEINEADIEARLDELMKKRFEARLKIIKQIF